MLKIIVCIKQVIDPEAPASAFKVDEEKKQVIPPRGTSPVINPFDENALEAALKLKDTNQAEITVISMGKNLAKPVLRKSLAAGADRLFLLDDEFFTDMDSYASALILAAFIKKIGEYDLILCGRQASDTDAGVVGSGIAQILGLPVATVARKIGISGNMLIVERLVQDGFTVLNMPMPCVVTVSNEIGALRSPALAAIMAAQKKNVDVVKAADIGLDFSQINPVVRLVKLSSPPAREGQCEMINFPSPEENGVKLAQKLREAGII
jgi:electron transfer flavoprotein beta subunit